MNTLKVGDLTLCSRLGDEEFEIVSENNQTREFNIKSLKTGKTHPIFKVHCAPGSTDMMMRNMRRRRETKLARAAKIGNPTPKKK